MDEEIKQPKKIYTLEYMHNSNITKIDIPEGIEEISERAFFSCENLKKVTTPSSLLTIESSAFSNCLMLEEVQLNEGITKIGHHAFADCKRLKKINIPESVERIDWAAFAGCENLEEIVLPNSLKNLSEQLFLNCKKLKKVTLPNNITSIPSECFKGCHKLDIKLNNNITTVEDRAFEDCYYLSTYPKQITSAGLNSFRNCRNLTTVTLNQDLKCIADGMFDGCINLSFITYPGQELFIGKRAFRNCKSLTEIPNFIKNLNEQAFENCIDIKDVFLSFNTSIPFACFRGCTNLKSINWDAIRNIYPFAFSNCTSLEEALIENSNVVSAEAFSNCINLKTALLNSSVKRIGTRAFYNCQNLEKYNLPDAIEYIDKEAFKKCNKITTLVIPASLKFFGDQAFSYMPSLTRIEVSPLNKTYITHENKVLINTLLQRLELYACGLTDKTFSLEDYNVEIDVFNRHIIRPISGIGKYAFAGNEHLEELVLCCCTNDIEYTAWKDCPKLKTLRIKPIEFFTVAGINLRNNGRYYIPEACKTEADIPFETVIFENGDEESIIQINQYALPYFKNLKVLSLPNKTFYNIFGGAFVQSINLKEVDIPNQVTNIGEKSFPRNTILKFENGLVIDNLVNLIHSKENIGDHKLYTLENGQYYIEQNNRIISLSKDEIRSMCSHPEAIENNPTLFMSFMSSLKMHDLDIPELKNGILFAKMSLENQEILFNNIKKDDQFALNVIIQSGLLDKIDYHTEYLLKDNNFQRVIDFINLYKKYNVTEPILYNKILFYSAHIQCFEKLIKDDLELLIKILKTSSLLNVDKELEQNTKEGKTGYELTNISLIEDTLVPFINAVKKYNIKDRFLIDIPFISVANNDFFEQFFKVFDANTKRLIKKSEILEDYSSLKNNLEDLFVLLKITGALEDDPLIRQRASTFISEKIFEGTLPNGKTNKYRIVGNDIHRIFNFPKFKRDFDKEFADFFLENYQELYEIESQQSGFIQRTYLNFREISRTCTSNKGSQRKLKVTVKKCKSFLSSIKFDGVTIETQPFAKLLSKWYDDNNSWIKAQTVYNESLQAPRNIFTKIKYDEYGKPIYDQDPKKDLKERLSTTFSYEWLPKQSYDNVILGKYCNCCAHVSGAGSGIMRASMILDCCQNLVIRDENGTIIAKSTLYINRERGYGVFNNVESSMSYRHQEDLRNIYQAFIRGVNAFLDVYNKNNSIPINTITIGANRNTIIDYLTDDKHPKTSIYPSICYGEYSFSGSSYDGDWKTTQRLVAKR